MYLLPVLPAEWEKCRFFHSLLVDTMYFLNCRTSVDELQKLKYTIETLYGSTCDILPADISHSDEVDAMFQKIYHSWDALDVLINNAGISHIGLLSDMSNERMGSRPKDQPFFRLLLLPSRYSCNGCQTIRTNHQRLFHVGDFRRFLRNCLLRFQGRSQRTYPRPCQRTCPQQYSGQCCRIRRH